MRTLVLHVQLRGFSSRPGFDSHWLRLTEPEGPLHSDWLLPCEKWKLFGFYFVVVYDTIRMTMIIMIGVNGRLSCSLKSRVQVGLMEAGLGWGVGAGCCITGWTSCRRRVRAGGRWVKGGFPTSLPAFMVGNDS